jgi:hypothetical protein
MGEANMNSHNTPATTGATAYGHINRVLYKPAPRPTLSAITASSSDTDRPVTATKRENTAVVLNESR